jgi:amidophosphoribosyltransferase
MSGIFGIVGKEDCIEDLFYGAFYVQHRAQDYCGIALFDSDKNKIENYTHKGVIKQKFPKQTRKKMNGCMGLGIVSGSRQPVSELSKSEGMVLCYDGNIINYKNLKDKILKNGDTFSGYHNPEDINDSVLISKIISKENKFEKGIENLFDLLKGDFAIVALTREGIYAARGYGRKPLILGKKDSRYCVASESNSFVNQDFKIVRDINPGEVVFLDKGGIQQVKQFNLPYVKYGTFEWIYTAYPTSIIDGRNVAEVRKNLGSCLATRFPVVADIVSGIPNSGRWHGIGLSIASGIPYQEVFIRYDYSDRSYTPSEQEDREEIGRKKLIVLASIIKGKKVVIVDDSIVRGNQTREQTKKLKEKGAKEVHARIACPPLLSACPYGKTTREDEECISRRMSIEEIRETRGLDSLGYATIEDLEKAIGFSRENLCLDCWSR